MGRIRVLIVDDAVVVRRLLDQAISSDPALEVAGTAPSGRIALEKISRLNPDLVVLDIEMPEMDGLQTLAAIRRARPELPVIMFSNLTRRGAEATMDALFLGASDYVSKPATAGGPAAALQRVREELLPRIRSLGARSADAAPLPAARRGPSAKVTPSMRRVDIVAIGVSTGGPNALATIFSRLPAAFPVPVLVVQHMPPVFTTMLAERLASRSAISVSEGAHGEVLRARHAWIAPGDVHMSVERCGGENRILLAQGPPENSCRPAVDVLLRSVADVYGDGALTIVLTGMGQDGFRGCEAVHEAGGQILVQDEETSIVWGMPGFVARSGLADMVLPLDRITGEIIRRVEVGRPAGAGTRAPALREAAEMPG